MFVGAVVVLIGEDIVIDPNPKQSQSKTVELRMGYLPSKNKMIHL